MMAKKGFYFKELRVVGAGKDAAFIKFEKGLNLLSGPSNTGKSYVFKCLEYMLGRRDTPKGIKESKGYENIFLEICNYFSGKIITLKREMGSPKVSIMESSIDDFDISKAEEYSCTHSSKNDKNISTFLLKEIGLNKSKIIFNATKNKKKEISIRDLDSFFLVNETIITSEKSLIYSGNYADKTKEESIFKLLLTGVDDDEFETIQDLGVKKTMIRGKIEFIEEKIKNNEISFKKIKESLEELELSEINIKIDELTHLLNISNETISEKEKERGDSWKKLKNIYDKIKQLKEIKKRFFLLEKNYETDIRRLEFINEGTQLIGQLNDVKCPTCDGKIESFGELSEDFIQSITKEAGKIIKKRLELNETIIELNAEIQNKEEVSRVLSKDFEKIELYINNKLKPIEEFKEQELTKYLSLKEDRLRVSILKAEINFLKEEKKYYEEKLSEKEGTAESRVLRNEVYQNFCDNVKYFVKEWGINCENIRYNQIKNDILINDELRENHGKGYRAIFGSAFILGILKNSLDNKIKHPFTIVLDSPLTAYKGQEEIEEGDINVGDIQDLFFENLSSFCKESDVQIFVLDNKSPSKNPSDGINHITFTKNRLTGRYGFF